MVLLQTVLIVILVYYGLKLLFKWLGPRLLNYVLKKTGERFMQDLGGAQGFGAQGAGPRQTGRDKDRVRKSNPSKKVGEYIDFEEID